VETTMIYLRQIERIMGPEADAMMREFDALYGVLSGLSDLDLQASKERPVA